MYIAVDIGGTNIRLAAAEDLSRLSISEQLMQAKTSGSFEEDMQFIAVSAQTLGRNALAGLGIGVTGDIDEAKTMVVRSVNNPYWDHNPIVPRLAQELACPVFLENDAAAGALGEAYYGDIDTDFAYVVWGTGIGGVLVKKDEDTQTVEVDNINVKDWDSYFSEWHYVCSGSAIMDKFGMSADKLPTEKRVQVFAEFVDYLQRFSRTVGMRRIVLGGGVAAQFRAEFAALPIKTIRCSVSAFDDRAGIYGAFGVIRHALLNEQPRDA